MREAVTASSPNARRFHSGGGATMHACVRELKPSRMRSFAGGVATARWSCTRPSWRTHGSYARRANTPSCRLSATRTLDDLRRNARFMRVSPAGLRESHVHDVYITLEAPNYRLE